jgi:exopolysaccharide production protein ExoQ
MNQHSLTMNGEQRLEANAAGKVDNTGIWLLLSTWVLLLPLAYFATGGNFLTSRDFARGGNFSGPSTGDTVITRVQQIVAWVVVLLITVPDYRRVMNGVAKNRSLWILLLFCCASTLWSPGLADSFRRIILLALTFWLGYFLVERFQPVQQMQVIAATGAFIAISSLLTAVFLPQIGLMDQGEWKGIFDHKTGMGIAICFLMSPLLFLELRGLEKKAVRLGLLVLAVFLLYESQSRGAWVDSAVLIVFAMISAIIKRLRSLDALVITLLSSTGIGIIGYLIGENFAAFTYLIGKDPGLTHRTEIWKAVMASVMKKPLFGYGYGGFWNGLQGESANVISAVGVNLSHAHNGFLNLFLQIGFIGSGILLVVLINASRDFIRVAFSQKHAVAYWYASIIVVTVVGSLDESFILRYNNMTTVLLVMACVGLTKAAKGEYADDLPRAS